MSEMVERVARAISGCGCVAGGRCGMCLDMMDAARAAIGAMREPTGPVARALFFGLDAPGLVGPRMPVHIDALWAAAIDAALKE